MPLQAVYIIRIYIPIDPAANTMAENLPNVLHTLGSRAPSLDKILDIVRNFEGIGHLGLYDNVYELSTGEEYYTPREGSHPSKGHQGIPSGGRVVILTTYGNYSQRAEIEQFVEAVAEAHDWEHPVIEVLDPNGRPMLWMSKCQTPIEP